MRTAYLIAWIDKKTEKVLTCSICSSKQKVEDKAIPAILFKTKAETIAEAITDLKRLIKMSPHYVWTMKYLA